MKVLNDEKFWSSAERLKAVEKLGVDGSIVFGYEAPGVGRTDIIIKRKFVVLQLYRHLPNKAREVSYHLLDFEEYIELLKLGIEEENDDGVEIGVGEVKQ